MIAVAKERNGRFQSTPRFWTKVRDCKQVRTTVFDSLGLFQSSLEQDYC